MKETLKIILVSALATAALIKAVPAFAEDAGGTNVSIVRTADLDLSTTAGRRLLDQRIAVAARAVCAGASTSDLKAVNAADDCREDVAAKARAMVENRLAAGDRGPISIAAAE